MDQGNYHGNFDCLLCLLYTHLYFFQFREKKKHFMSYVCGKYTVEKYFHWSCTKIDGLQFSSHVSPNAEKLLLWQTSAVIIIYHDDAMA